MLEGYKYSEKNNSREMSTYNHDRVMKKIDPPHLNSQYEQTE